jgi:hydrogenase small subunit
MAEIDILRITAGLGCDGDTVAMTTATLPSLEDVLLGAAVSPLDRERVQRALRATLDEAYVTRSRRAAVEAPTA